MRLPLEGDAELLRENLGGLLQEVGHEVPEQACALAPATSTSPPAPIEGFGFNSEDMALPS